MNFCDIPLYSVLPEVEDCVTEIFLQNCDSATMLGSEYDGISSIYDLYGTEYEDIIPAYVSSCEGESWGMRGKLFSFRLTEELKAHIRKGSLTCIFKEGDKYILENLTLYRGDKCMFTCCSHEAFDLVIPELTDELADEVLRAVKATIERTELFAQMQAVNNGITKKPESVEKDLAILRGLCCYVDQAKGWWIYQPPKYKCDFVKFRKIAKKYLTPSTYAVLDKVEDYADLQPLPVPQTADEVVADLDKTYGPHYNCTEYYRQVDLEIFMLQYIREINGLGSRTQKEKQSAPCFVMRSN